MDEKEIRELYRHLEGWDKSDIWFENYVLLKCQLIAVKILPFIHRGIRNFTSHGIEHSKSVILNINTLIDILKYEGELFSQAEIRLVYMAAWLHDIGNIKENSRDIHSLESCTLIDKLDNEIGFGNLLDPLKFIVKYHSSGYKKGDKYYKLDITKVPNKPFKIKGDKIKLPLLCAIFRLADACDVGENRAFDIVYSLINEEFDEEAKQHWESNNAIVDLSFEKKERCINITVKEKDKQKAEFVITKIEEELQSVIGFLGKKFPCRGVKISFEPSSMIEDYK